MIDFIGSLILVVIILILTLTIHKVRTENAKLKEHLVQLSHARSTIAEDLRWLGHNKIARAICTRHANLLHSEWRKIVHVDPGKFRQDIGLEPDFKNTGESA